MEAFLPFSLMMLVWKSLSTTSSSSLSRAKPSHRSPCTSIVNCCVHVIAHSCFSLYFLIPLFSPPHPTTLLLSLSPSLPSIPCPLSFCLKNTILFLFSPSPWFSSLFLQQIFSFPDSFWTIYFPSLFHGNLHKSSQNDWLFPQTSQLTDGTRTVLLSFTHLVAPAP